MASRLRVLGFFVVVLGGCQKDRDDVGSVAAASGTTISATGNGSGGAGGTGDGGAGSTGDGGATATGSVGGSGAVTTTSGAPGSGGAGPSASSGGDGGDASGSGTGGAPAGPGSSTSSGGNPTTCGDDVDCWGDEPSLCTTSICEEAFTECVPNEPSPFAYACGNFAVILRTGVWAHFVDCLRDAAPDVECEDGDAGVTTCLEEARAEACASDDVDALCEDAGVACPGFEVDACKEDVAIFGDVSIGDYYQGCVEPAILDGDACAGIHAACI